MPPFQRISEKKWKQISDDDSLLSFVRFFAHDLLFKQTRKTLSQKTGTVKVQIFWSSDTFLNSAKKNFKKATWDLRETKTKKKFGFRILSLSRNDNIIHFLLLLFEDGQVCFKFYLNLGTWLTIHVCSWAIAICLGRPGSNPGTGVFQFRIVVNLLSLSVKLFLIKCNRTEHTLPSSFLFPIIIYHIKNLSIVI